MRVRHVHSWLVLSRGPALTAGLESAQGTTALYSRKRKGNDAGAQQNKRALTAKGSEVPGASPKPKSLL